MSVRRIVCPECGSGRYGVLKEHNPETTSMNMDVTLKCDNPLCTHEWEARTMSNHARKMQQSGQWRI